MTAEVGSAGGYSLSAYEGMNGAAGVEEEGRLPRKDVTLIVKAATIDPSRIGADLFCQEFWMELYALYELGLLKVDIKAANVNSEAFKRNFLGSQPPILVEPEKGLTYTDNRDLESRIFHLAKEFSVPLFEKDLTVETKIENLYRNFKIFLRSKTEAEKSGENGANGAMPQVVQPSYNKLLEQLAGNTPFFLRSKTEAEKSGENGANGAMPQVVQPSYNKLLEQLAGINSLLRERGTRYLLGSSMTEYDCELMPRLHHIRVAGAQLCGLEIPSDLVHLWAYLLTTYRTAAFIESCPADQDIIYHYKEQLNLGVGRSRESLQKPTKTHTIPGDALEEIKRLGL